MLAIIAAVANTLVSIATLIGQVLTARRLERIEQRTHEAIKVSAGRRRLTGDDVVAPSPKVNP
jgi:NADH:ubiquinone oxidoreductase subunit 3 (subunit A)